MTDTEQGLRKEYLWGAFAFVLLSLGVILLYLSKYDSDTYFLSGFLVGAGNITGLMAVLSAQGVVNLGE